LSVYKGRGVVGVPPLLYPFCIPFPPLHNPAPSEYRLPLFTAAIQIRLSNFADDKKSEKNSMCVLPACLCTRAEGLWVYHRSCTLFVYPFRLSTTPHLQNIDFPCLQQRFRFACQILQTTKKVKKLNVCAASLSVYKGRGVVGVPPLLYPFCIPFPPLHNPAPS
jgi:hypothetical protein